MKEFVLNIGLAFCTPNTDIVGYGDLRVSTHDSLVECMIAADMSQAEHAFCTEKTYAPETSIRPKPRG